MQIGIIGCGNMGAAIAQGLSKSHTLFLYDYLFEKSKKLKEEGLGQSCQQLTEVLCLSEMVILAVKPQNLKEIASQMTPSLSPSLIIVSLLAGVSVHTLKYYFPKQWVLRAMPNIAVAYGEGVLGLATDFLMPPDRKIEISEIFKNLGQVHWIPEEKMNALTALTGSGPAFCFAIIEAMIEAGIAMGFTAAIATELVYQMVRGSLALLTHTGKHPEVLKEEVTSPQGTTAAGLKKLEESAFRDAILKTFLAAYDRSKELSLENQPFQK